MKILDLNFSPTGNTAGITNELKTGLTGPGATVDEADLTPSASRKRGQNHNLQHRASR